MSNDIRTGRQRGLWSKLTDRLTKSPLELEASELLEDTARLGGTPIRELPDRELATVCGAVRSVTLRPRSEVPALVVDLFDGSKALHLVWLGRRQIAGIEPGVYLRATGRVTHYRGTPTMFNAQYEIVPPRA